MGVDGTSARNDSYKYTWNQYYRIVIKAINTYLEFKESMHIGVEISIVLESTSFYAETSGQILDTESIHGPIVFFKVCTIQIFRFFFLHTGSLLEYSGNEVEWGNKVIDKGDCNRRQLLESPDVNLEDKVIV